MEPFGLFNLLNSLLNAAPKTTAENEENPSPQKEENPSATQQNASETQKPNACAAFFEAHDKRAKRK